MKRTLLMAGLIVCLAGCRSAPETQPRRIAFNPSEFAPYSQKGSATIAGRALLLHPKGGEQPAAFRQVVCVPVTGYTRETHERTILRGEFLGAPDRRYLQYRVAAITDENGRFEFRDLPAGSYYVTLDITREYIRDTREERRSILPSVAEVGVEEGETVKIVLKRWDL